MLNKDDLEDIRGFSSKCFSLCGWLISYMKFQCFRCDLVSDFWVNDLLQDEISSPITAEIFDFCDNELFPSQTLTTSEAASCSNCCHDDNSYYSAGMSLPPNGNFGGGFDDNGINTAAGTTAAIVATDNICSNYSMIFQSQDDMDNNVSGSINFSPCGPFSVQVPQYLATASQENQFEIVPNDPVTTDGVTQYPNQVIEPLITTHPLEPVFEDECLSSVPSIPPPCTLLDLSLGPYLLDNLSPTLSAADNFIGSNLFMGSEIQQPQSLSYQEDCNSYFCHGTIPRTFYTGDIQVLVISSYLNLNPSCSL